jgi:shikimate kinase
MPADDRLPRHIVFVGLMGAGKTVIGQRVARRLGRPFRDSDRDLQAATGLTVRELRDRDGVEPMHALEAQQLLEALADPQPSVIAAAASTIDVPDCRAALRGPEVAVVWLRAAPRVLARRFDSRTRHRPEYGPSREAFLRDQAASRGPLLASVDPVVIDADTVGPGEAAELVLRALRALG